MSGDVEANVWDKPIFRKAAKGADVTFATWLFNPWDFGDAALLFAVVVAVTSSVATPFRARLGGGLAGLSVAAVVTTIYMIGATATGGFGPLAPLGALMLFLPATVIAVVAMWVTGQILRPRRPGDLP
jgi:hypothetical protein